MFVKVYTIFAISWLRKLPIFGAFIEFSALCPGWWIQADLCEQELPTQPMHLTRGLGNVMSFLCFHSVFTSLATWLMNIYEQYEIAIDCFSGLWYSCLVSTAHRRRSIKDNIHVWKGIKTGVEEAGTRARARFCRIVHVVFLYLRAWRDSADKSICPLTCFASLPDSNVPSWFLAQSPSAKVVQTVSWGLDAQFGVVLLTVAYLQHFQPCAFKDLSRLFLVAHVRSHVRFLLHLAFFRQRVVYASNLCDMLKFYVVNIWTISLWSMS